MTRCGSGIPLVAHPTARKWVITPVTNGISRVNLLIYNWGELTHLLYKWDEPPSIVLEFDLENVDKCGDHIRDFNIFQALLKAHSGPSKC